MHFESGEYSIAPVYFLPELHRKFCSGFIDTFIGGFGKNAESLIEQAFLYLCHGLKVLFVYMLQGTLQGFIIENKSRGYIFISGIPIQIIHYQSEAPSLSGAFPKKRVDRFCGCMICANGLFTFFFSSISPFNCS